MRTAPPILRYGQAENNDICFQCWNRKTCKL